MKNAQPASQPLTTEGLALVVGVMDLATTWDLESQARYLAASCGFTMAPMKQLARGPWRTYARNQGGAVTLRRNLDTGDAAAPWRLTIRDSVFDLWPAEIEEEPAISGAAVFLVYGAAGALVLIILGLVAHLARFW